MNKIFRKILPAIIFLFPVLLFGQVKTVKYFYNEKQEKCDSSDAETIQYYLYSDTIKKSGKIKIVDMEGNLQSECEYENMIEKFENGKSTYFYKTGEISRIENYKRGKLDGEFVSYYKNGKKRRIDVYEAGEMISGKCFTSKGDDTTYFKYQIMPEFIGGIQKLHEFIGVSVIYPPEALENDIMGKVYVAFLVEKNGEISDVKIVKSVDPLLDKEAIRVVKSMPKWNPGFDDGEAVRVRFNLPINFKIDYSDRKKKR